MQKYLTGETIVYSAKNEADKEFEWALPEYLPGVAGIVKTDVQTEKCTFIRQETSASLEIHLKFCILYVSDFEGRLKNAVFRETFTIPFKEAFECQEDYTAIPSCYIGNLISKPSSNRKVYVKFTIFASCSAVGETSKALYEKDESNSICVLKKQYGVCRKTTLPESYFEHEAEIVLDDSKPSVGEIIYVSAVPSKSSAKVLDGELDFETVFTLTALYEAASEDGTDGVSYVTVCSDITVKDLIKDDKFLSVHEPCIYIDVNSAEPAVSYDAYGENKVLSFNIKYSLCGFLYSQENMEFTEDAFSDTYKYSMQMTSIPIDSISERISETVNISVPARCDMGGIQEISESFAKLLSASTEYIEGKYFINARCRVEVMGTNALGELICADCPATLHIPVSGDGTSPSNDLPDILLNIISCKAALKEGELLCDFEVSVNGFMLSHSVIKAVEDFTESQEKSVNTLNNEIVVCYPQNNEILWNIAKKYCAKPEDIKIANALEDDDISSKHIIIIP